MAILLIHRIWRDDARCKGKYGKYWDEYGKVVKWKLLPVSTKKNHYFFFFCC
jgi:7-dehydrocholesterol reductase